MTPRIAYRDCKSSFRELLIDNNSLKIHHRNLQKFVNEIFKVDNGLSLELMNDVFSSSLKKPYSQRADSHFRSKSIRTAKML